MRRDCRGRGGLRALPQLPLHAARREAPEVPALPEHSVSGSILFDDIYLRFHYLSTRNNLI